LFESVYELVLAHELRSRGLHVERQLSIPVRYENLVFDEGFRADLVINKKLIVEVKSVEATKPVHKKQLLTYLRLADMRLGLLINFGTELIKQGVHRVVNRLEE
jgi:GxxExxY protein